MFVFVCSVGSGWDCRTRAGSHQRHRADSTTNAEINVRSLAENHRTQHGARWAGSRQLENLINLIFIQFLIRFQRNYNNAKAETLKWEKILAKAKDYIADNEKETIVLVDSIQHLYQLLSKRNDDKVKLKKFDISGQLDYVRDEIEILEDIIKRARHKMAKEGMSLLGEGSNRFLNLDKGTNLSD